MIRSSAIRTQFATSKSLNKNEQPKESRLKKPKPLHFHDPENLQIPEIETGREDLQIIYPSGLEFGVISISLCPCVFFVGLVSYGDPRSFQLACRRGISKNATILTTAIPRITDEFHSVADVGWYDAAFRLTSCISQLSQGKLFTQYNVKWVFLINIVIFEIGILISGVAPSSVVFIIGRAITTLGFSGTNQGCVMYKG
ncbi:uncharacterized protein EAE97_002527 [Botrytis byssoidea]|uniref:Major facilitator superfamily (MFS) profile domain-containing protein n=1 Tax=Botrytis byssoidea TaxID=139641 RepID=A0A9P5M8T4_9HELO|nr:uncharacterized protein EAE97_002527 [Botrytis byssoidea]KAF7950975.1 hypothetical protein EAE97_002527 [Botrytis byssoidea]